MSLFWDNLCNAKIFGSKVWECFCVSFCSVSELWTIESLICQILIKLTWPYLNLVEIRLLLHRYSGFERGVPKQMRCPGAGGVLVQCFFFFFFLTGFLHLALTSPVSTGFLHHGENSQKKRSFHGLGILAKCETGLSNDRTWGTLSTQPLLLGDGRPAEGKLCCPFAPHCLKSVFIILKQSLQPAFPLCDSQFIRLCFRVSFAVLIWRDRALDRGFKKKKTIQVIDGQVKHRHFPWANLVAFLHLTGLDVCVRWLYIQQWWALLCLLIDKLQNCCNGGKC